MFGRSYWLPIRLLGIPLELDVSFLIVLPILAWLIGSQVALFARQFGLPPSGALTHGWMPYALGLLAAIGLFVGVVLHELGHAVVARAYGVKVRSITLWFLGGVARLEEIPQRPGAEAIVGIAGPIVSFILAAICLAATRAVSRSDLPVQFVLRYLAWMNLVLGIFNLLPALPLDGGRVLRSLLALFMPRMRATQIAAVVSRVLAGLMAVAGIISGDFWILLVAGFIWLAVNSEVATTQLQGLLRGAAVRDVMNPDVRTVPPELSVSDLMQRMLQEHHSGFPVMDGGGKLLGMVGARDLAGHGPEEPVARAMRPAPTIRQTAPAAEALRLMSDNDFARLAAVDDRDHLAGIITKGDLIRLMQLRQLDPDAPRAFARRPGHVPQGDSAA